MKFKLMTAMILVSLTPLASQAEHYGRDPYRSGGFSDLGIYAFGGLGHSDFDYSEEDFRYSFDDGTLRDIDQENTSAAARVGMGLMFSPGISVELGYANLGSFSARARSNGVNLGNNGFAAGRVDMDADADGAFVGLSLSSPMQESLGAYLRGGVYAWEVEGELEDSARHGRFSIEGSDPYVGGGIRLAISRQSSLQIGYDYYWLDDDESFEAGVGVVSADLMFYF